jgi:hypothetical protein
MQVAQHNLNCTYVCVPVVYVPVAARCCCGGYPMKVPHSIEAQSGTPNTVIIGGTDEVSLTLEYLIEAGAKSPAVKVTSTFNAADSTWSAADVAPGYHVEEAFMRVKPGTKTTVTVTDAMARLRWCETICC